MPIGLTIDGANRHDMKMVRPTLESMVAERPEPTEEQPQGMCLDKGYDYDEVREILEEFGFTAHIKARGEEAKEVKAEAGKRARRWVVERSHSWMNRFRRMLVCWYKQRTTTSPCVLLGYSDRLLAVTGPDDDTIRTEFTLVQYALIGQSHA